MNGRKPEGAQPPELHYDREEAETYTKRSRVVQVQQEMTSRCLELLDLPDDTTGRLLLDIGCGSGLSGDILSQSGHLWIGIDVAPAMLSLAQENEVEGDLVLGDIGQPGSWRPGTFDGAVSVSVIQWLCHAFTSSQDPRRRLKTFFQWLYSSLNKTARAVLQFYPSHDQQTEMIGKAAKEAGFAAGFVVDNPESDKKKKVYLLLSVGVPITSIGGSTPSRQLDGEMSLTSPGDQVAVGNMRTYGTYERKGRRREGGKRQSIKHKDWVLQKKEQQRQKNLEVRPDSRYTGRRRKDGF